MSITYYSTTNPAKSWLNRIAELVYNDPFFYLAGPMSGRPGFNYKEFDRVSEILRGQGYLISSPAEYEHEQQRAAILAATGNEPHDEVGPTWRDCLARDVCVVAHPSCIGIILLDGWRESRGACLETYVAAKLDKPLYEFHDYDEGPVLQQIDRDLSLPEN